MQVWLKQSKTGRATERKGPGVGGQKELGCVTLSKMSSQCRGLSRRTQ